jgi:uncharacterized membrane protein YfcA
VFAPVLFFHFQAIGVSPQVVTQLAIGSSLLCTIVASVASAYYQHARGAVHPMTAVKVGIASAAAVFLMTRFVTSQPWYDGDVFKVVFAILLTGVAIRMLVFRNSSKDEGETSSRHVPWPWHLGIGSAAGIISVAAGVGGGVVLVPAYHQVMRYPMKSSVGTSSATIVIIALVGVATYILTGWGAVGTTSTSVGFVDVARAVLLSVPAAATAPLGVRTGHYINTRTLKRTFAVLMLLIAVRLIWSGLT